MPDALPRHLYRYREYNEKDDRDFVNGCWLRSYRNALKTSQCFTELNDELFFRYHQRRIERLHENSQVVLICNPEDEGHLFGYVVFERTERGEFILHYVFMKKMYRKFGLARELIASLFEPEEETFIYTHLTDQGSRLLRSLNLKSEPIFNPYWRLL